MSSYMQPCGEVATKCNRALLAEEETWGHSLTDRPSSINLPIGLLPDTVGSMVHKEPYFVAMYWTVGS